MKKTVFIGVDVSKKTIDYCSIQLDLSGIVNNDIKGFNELITLINKRLKSDEQIRIAFENTGIYSQSLAEFCSKKEISFYELVALDVKKSIGITRGKNDRVDAKRICAYAMEKSDKLKVSPAADSTLTRLKRLINLRDSLVISKSGHIQRLKELQEVLDLNSKVLEIKVLNRIIKEYDEAITKIKKEIEGIIKQSPAINRNFQLLCSIKGVGFVIAVYVIVYTKNFTCFADSRKFSCYCGTAPFQHQSGTSVRGKTKVSHLANKKLKSILEMGARSAITCDPELRVYYKQRVESGKNKTSTLNIIRNKLIHRMFAVINRQTPYIIKNAA